MVSEELRSVVDRYEKGFRRFSKLWAVAHHTAVSGVAIITAATGGTLLGASSSSNGRNVATVMAFVAAALTGANGVWKFGQKWQADRNAWLKIDELKIDIMDTTTSDDMVRRELKNILEEQRRAWNASI